MKVFKPYLTVLIMFLITLCYSQQLSLDYDSDIPKTSPSQLEVNGSLKAMVWITYTPDALLGTFSNSTIYYNFKNNLLNTRLNVDFNDSYTYDYSDGNLQRESWAGSGLGFYSYKREGNKISKFLDTNMNAPSVTINLNKNDKIVEVKKPTSSYKVTYVDANPNSDIKEKVETIISGDNKDNIIINKTTNVYSTAKWRGLNIKVKTSTYYFENTDTNTKRTTTGISFYNDKNRLVYYKETNPSQEILKESEYFYKDDIKGNWVSKTQFDLKKNKLIWYEQRQITYSNGLVTGNSSINKNELQDLPLPKFKNQYYFKKDQASNNFWLYDNTGVSIVGKLGLNNYLNTYNIYSIDLMNNNVIELSNFWNIKDNEFHPAKILSQESNSFIVVGNDNDLDFVINGVLKDIANLKVLKLYDGKSLIFDKSQDKSFVLTIPEKSNSRFFPMEELKPSKNGAYCVAFKTKNNNIYYVFIERGQTVNPNKETFILSGKSEYIKTDLGYYKVENFANAKPNEIYLPKNVLAEDFNKAKDAYDKLMSIKTPVVEKTTPITSSTSLAKKTNNFDCNTDETCLINYFNSRINNLVSEGKTKDEASKITGAELESVFKNNPELGYNVLMKIDQKYLVGIMSGISKETKRQLRSMAMSEVKAYTDKYGSKKIKTVPYKKKSNN